jgi:hypothetical protein
MFKLIPEPYQLLARLALAAVLLAGAAAGGAIVNGWRLDGVHQRALAAKDRRIGELQAAISDQNRAVEAMKLQSEAADQRRQVAEKYAADVIQRIRTRDEVVATSKATDCAGVLKEAWGVWK